ncbi:cobalamin-binding protein [Pseudomonas paeninsulae]|uniref:cobalamin-binding protein n=1 Tax=Pseudomonas paeninsulae TaxID=3110772 RepID=UPI002D7A26AF|nr:cobalamin-binding protein [Pseudomonas sp. IT1137]
MYLSFARQRGLSTCRVGLAAALLGLAPTLLAAPICVVDDAQREVCLPTPAQRIASLSPGATELVFAAGGGDRVVAVVAFSDYPPEARTLPSVGSHSRLDLERLLTLQPDLAIVWGSGNPAEQLDALEDFGVPVFYLEPENIEGIARAIERLARLTDSQAVGQQAAEHLRRGIAALAEQYREAEPVTVFYQVWNKPLMTVNDGHLIGQVISLCGGRNVFAELPRQIPRIDIEAVLIANPQVILAGGMGEENRYWLTEWRAYPSLQAVQQDNLFFIPPSLVQRPTPRLLEGARLLCESLETSRARR